MKNTFQRTSVVWFVAMGQCNILGRRAAFRAFYESRPPCETPRDDNVNHKIMYVGTGVNEINVFVHL